MPSFKEVKGQDRAVGQLQRDLARDMVSHAYLFCGEKGIGKTMAAIAMAQTLLCLDRHVDDPCNICRNCSLVVSNQHPQVELLSPLGTSYRIEQMRELHRKCSFSNSGGEYQVFILSEADKMSVQAANSLLKLLEDPPLGYIFILTAVNPGAMLPTIVSRCRVVKFSLLPREVLAERLVAEGKTRAEAEFVSQISGGSLGKALELAKSTDVFRIRRKAMELLRDIWCASAERMPFVTRTMDQEENLEELLDGMTLFSRDLVIWQQSSDEGLLINRDYLDDIKTQCSDLAEAGGQSPKTFFETSLRELIALQLNLERKANKRLALDVFVWKLFKIRQGLAIDYGLR